MPLAPTSCVTRTRNTSRARLSPGAGTVARSPGMPAFPGRARPRPRPRLPPHPAGHCRSDLCRRARNQNVPGPTAQPPLDRCRPAACHRAPRRLPVRSHWGCPEGWRPSRPRRWDGRRRPVGWRARRMSHQPWVSQIRPSGGKASRAGAPGRAPLGRTSPAVPPSRSTNSAPLPRRDLRPPLTHAEGGPVADGGDSPAVGTCGSPESSGCARRAEWSSPLGC